MKRRDFFKKVAGAVVGSMVVENIPANIITPVVNDCAVNFQTQRRWRCTDQAYRDFMAALVKRHETRFGSVDYVEHPFFREPAIFGVLPSGEDSWKVDGVG